MVQRMNRIAEQNQDEDDVDAELNYEDVSNSKKFKQ